MATLVFTVAGAAAGSALLPAGLTIFGATISGATIGATIGSVIGGQIDQALLRPGGRHVEGPRLNELQLQSSTEGAAILRVFGRARVAGQVIWAANFMEVETTSEVSSGGGKGGSGGSSTTVTEYAYFASFAVALCEGEIGGLGRVWADGKPLDLAANTYRLYKGTETQMPDALIEAIEGADAAPAYRGIAYIVFEDLPLERFGNRVPQLNFEVFRKAPGEGGPAIDTLLKGVDLMPGSGEFVYATEPVARALGPGETAPENVQNSAGLPNLEVSLDQLQAQVPGLQSALLVVSWFGDDMRCAECEIRPGVESAAKTTTPIVWRVNGVARAAAHLVSSDASGPLFGGTPADASIVQAIQELKSRGLRVVLYPFLLMDIPAASGKPNPYAPAEDQPAFPWRGRITVHPAPGVAGTPDKTATAATQLAAFFGGATNAHFVTAGTSVTYSGPADWGYRRFVLHYAHLAKAAGGIDAFLIGTEMRGLTQVRSSATAYPAVAELQALAGDVRAVLGVGTKLSYAADWSEYACHRPGDGSGDVFFNLDPLWSDPNIDFIAVDFYAPLADWRDGPHLDAGDWPSIHDRAYLQANVEGGEDYDWFYASAAARDAQDRTPIADGAYGEPWIYRAKDVRAWWSNAHHDRPAGVRSASATGWVPQSKPVWFTELGCPAVDKGANQPYVFYDAKSSEGGFPVYSNGRRDDLIQRRYIEALLDYWSPANGNNPVSAVYGAPMIDVANAHAWAWDARPFPDFPLRTEIWRDAPNWAGGHWLTGRLGQLSLADLVTALCAPVGIVPDVSGLNGLVDGYVLDRVMSPRDALEPLMLAFAFDALESEGAMRFRMRGSPPVITLARDDLAEMEEGKPTHSLMRAQETDLPRAALISFIESLSDYRQAAVETRRLSVKSDRVARAELPIVMEQARAQGIADAWVMETWMARERVEFALPPARLALEPGDTVTLDLGSRSFDARVIEATDAHTRLLSAVATDAGLYDIVPGPGRGLASSPAPFYGAAVLAFMDLPLLTGAETPHTPRVAAYAKPWPGTIAIYRGTGDDGFVLNATVGTRAILGETITDFYAGATGRWDEGNLLWVRVYGGELQSRARGDVQNGANALAVESADGDWEVVQFANAELIDTNTYKLSGFLRGQAGTEGAMRNPVASGARVVLLNAAVRELALTLDERNLPFNWRYGPQRLFQSDPAYVTETRAFAGVGLRPLSPVHVRAVKDGGTGDLAIAWTRRTRIGGDQWEASDVPLGEAFERYALDILDGATVKRTLTVSSPAAVYAAADQTTDFGGPAPSPLSVRVAQVSEIFGPGQPRAATLYF